jgi:hypothetical protein
MCLQANSVEGSIPYDKSVLTISEPKRIRSKEQDSLRAQVKEAAQLPPMGQPQTLFQKFE